MRRRWEMVLAVAVVYRRIVAGLDLAGKEAGAKLIRDHPEMWNDVLKQGIWNASLEIVAEGLLQVERVHQHLDTHCSKKGRGGGTRSDNLDGRPRMVSSEKANAHQDARPALFSKRSPALNRENEKAVLVGPNHCFEDEQALLPFCKNFREL